jgi:sn-glycerol 3-phosphate transport system permease protein
VTTVPPGPAPGATTGPSGPDRGSRAGIDPAATATATAAGSRAPRRSRRPMAGWVFLLPAFAVFATFVFLPLGRSVFLSFQGSDLFGRPAGFVGLRHYAELFTDPAFARVLLVTAGFTVLTVVPSIAAGLALSLLLHQRIRAVRLFRTAFALPFAFSVASASVVFSVLYNPAIGVLNGLLSRLGVDRIGWLTDPAYGLLSVSLASVWMQLGYTLLVLSAGLGAVPDDVVEAARLDGAHGWRLQRSIIVPMLTPQLFFLVVTGTIHALQSFGQIHILTRGGPDSTTTTLVYSIYEQAFANNNSNFGAASAQAIVLLVVVAVITGIQFGVLERKVFYR